MEQQSKSQVVAGILADVLTGNIGGAYAKSALAMQGNLASGREFLAKFSDKVAEAMEQSGGKMNEITVNGWSALDKLGANRLADVVLGVAIERAREINRLKVEAGRQLYSAPTRPVRDNPQA